MENSELQIVVTAKDEASAGLQQIGQSTQSLTSSVFKAQAAWGLLQAGMREAVDFIKGSVGVYLEAQKNLDLASATIRSLGGNSEQAISSIQQFSQKLGMLGANADDVTLAAAKLSKAAGGDISTGMNLAKLASDLTASGFGDLSSNVDNLSRVISGKGQRALMEYRINLSDSATTAEQLAAIQGKVTQTTEEYAQTIPGQIGIVTQQYHELQQAIGGGLVQALSDALTSSGLFDTSMQEMSDHLQDVKIFAYEVGNGLVLIGKTIWTLGDSIAGIGLVIQDLVDGHADKAFDDLKVAMDRNKGDIDSLSKTWNDLEHPIKAMDESTKKASETHKTMAKSAVADLSSVANANRSAENEVVKHSDAVAKMEVDYDKMATGAQRDLADLADTFKSDMKSIDDSISNTQREMSALTAEFNKGAADDAAGMADKIIASEQNIKDLKTKIAAEADTMKKSQLQSQLDAEQKNYDATADFRTNNAQAITEAERRAGLTQLQRDIEDYNTRRTLATTEYNQKLLDLSNTLAAEKQQKQDTIDLYNSRTAEINQILQKGNEEYQKLSDDRVSITKGEIDQEIKYFQDLASVISGVKSASSSSVSIHAPTASPRASGGPVGAFEPYIVGENGPEFFVPSQSGTIIPNHAIGTGGGQSIVVNLSGTFYTESEVARRMANQVAAIIGSQIKTKTI